MPLVTELFEFITSFNKPPEEVDPILPDIAGVHTFTGDVPAVCETTVTSIRRKMKKSVKFRTATVYYFPRAQGYSSIASQDGPTLGMSEKHFLVETYNLMEKLDHRIPTDHLDHRDLLDHPSPEECPLRPSAFTGLKDKENPLPVPMQALVGELLERPIRVCVPAKQEKLVGSTMFPVTLKERKKLLRDAGVSKVDAVEVAEAREIRMSRTLCGCNCKDVCRPDICFCSRSEIPCQVDVGSFPCACSASGCANPSGRLQFDLAQVRKQRGQKLAQLQIDNIVDRRDVAIDAVNVEFVISPAKRTKLAKKAGMSRKRGLGKKRGVRRETGKLLSSTRVSEEAEGFSGDGKVVEREDGCMTIRSESSFDGGCGVKSASSPDGKLIIKRTKFREPVQERLVESGLGFFAGPVMDVFRNKSNSPGMEDECFPRGMASHSRGFDLDPNYDLDLYDDVDLDDDLKLLVIGNENSEEAVTYTRLRAARELRDEPGLKYFGSIEEYDSKCGLSVDSKNDLHPVIDVDLESKYQVLESNNNLQSTRDLDLDNVSLIHGRLRPLVNYDVVSESASVESLGIHSAEIGGTEFTNLRDLGAVGNDLHCAFPVGSSVRKSGEQSFSCTSFLSRFLRNRLRKTADSDLASQADKSPDACAESQGHVVACEGHVAESEGDYEDHMTTFQGRIDYESLMTESQSHTFDFEGHIAKSQGHITNYEDSCVESQFHHAEFPDHCVELFQGHCIKSQGHSIESQGDWNISGAAQVTRTNLTVNAARPDDDVDICDIDAQSKVNDFCRNGSPFVAAVAMRDAASSTSDEVSSTPSSTSVEDSSCSSKDEDLSPSQSSSNDDLHINIEDDDLTDVTRAGSLLHDGSNLS